MKEYVLSGAERPTFQDSGHNYQSPNTPAEFGARQFRNTGPENNILKTRIHELQALNESATIIATKLENNLERLLGVHPVATDPSKTGYSEPNGELELLHRLIMNLANTLNGISDQANRLSGV